MSRQHDMNSFDQLARVTDFMRGDDRLTRPLPTADPLRKSTDSGDGPSKPDVKRPESRGILDRMKRVDPNQAKRYRQRSGQ